MTVRGDDSARFLHSQLTADIAGLEHHHSCLSALLDRSGRIQSFVFVLKEPQLFRVLVPSELVDTTLERLRRNLVADDVELFREPDTALALALGPVSVQLIASRQPDSSFPLEIYGQRGFVTWSPEPLPLPQLSAEEVAARRVLSGHPQWGLDVKPGQLVNETTLVDTAVAHNKGCYLGQETVHKIQSRRGASFAPMALEARSPISDPETLIGRAFTVHGGKGGTVLDSATWGGHLFLQASLFRDHRVEGLETACTFDGGQTIDVRVRRLPLIAPPSRHRTAEQLLEHAAKLFTAGQESKAEAVLERAIAVCPEHPDLYEALGVALGRRGDLDRAIALMYRLLEVDPTSVMAHANLSVYLKRLGRIEDAERELALARTARQVSSARVDSITVAPASDRHQPREDVSRRESMYMQVLAVDPEDPLALFNLGQLRFDDGRYQDAVTLFRRAVDAQPSHAQAHFRLGQTLEELGDPQQAASVYVTGVKAAASAGAHGAADLMQNRLAALTTNPGE